MWLEGLYRDACTITFSHSKKINVLQAVRVQQLPEVYSRFFGCCFFFRISTATRQTGIDAQNDKELECLWCTVNSTSLTQPDYI